MTHAPLDPSIDSHKKRRRSRRWATALTLTLVATSGCFCGGDSRPRRSKNSVKRTEVNAQNFLFNADEFDLETIISLVKENKVKGAEELEEVINGEKAAISNVDIDKDGTIDYVLVKEGREGQKIALDFRAVPSSTNQESDAETIASMTFSHNTTTNEVEVSGGYPSYANGHDNYYYSYRQPYRHGGMSVGQALFLAWLFTPSRPIFYRGYRPAYFVRRPVYSRSMLSSRRSTYRTTSRVSPVRRQARPKGYSISSASKGKSKFASGKSKVAKPTSFSSRSGSMKSFGKRDTSKTKKSASGFGASKSRSGGFGSNKKSSFGSSSGSKSRSSFGSSSRSSSSRSSFGRSSGSSSRSSFGRSSRSSSSGRRRR